MKTVEERIAELKIVPVVKLERTEDALPLASALIEGGIPAAEITFRTACAEESIRAVAKKYPDMLVGAGTVLNRTQAETAVAAGAKFIVSPGYDPETVQWCLGAGVPVFPGCVTASEVQRALAAGLTVLKFFPAEASGGLKAIQALSAPFGQVRWMPTGGIGLGNLTEYLAFPKIIACGGSYMVKAEDIRAKNWQKITDICRKTIERIHSAGASAAADPCRFEIVHVGINSDSAAQAEETVNTICALFGFPKKDGEKSLFVNGQIEVMKSNFRGKNGHIAVGTNDVQAAKDYLESKGAAFDASTENRDAQGKLLSVYLKNEIGGFAFHLVRKNG